MPNMSELAKELVSNGITHVAIVGIKTSHAVQATTQACCDLGLRVSVLRECVMDDDAKRHEAVLDHLLPIYASVVPMADWLENVVGLGQLTAQLQQLENSNSILDPSIRYFADCGRGGHALLYMSNLVKQSQGWSSYPLQPWFMDGFLGKSYWCPLGQQTLDFCDEPKFSKIAMYLKGREWLDEKEKIWEIAKDIMPTTYLVAHQRWVGGQEPESYDEETLCFVKECDKNGGRAVQVCGSLSNALAQCEPDTKYVIQTHVPSPLLTNAGHKCHIKAYFLLKEEYEQWSLMMYPEAFLCVGTVPWSDSDLSPEAQVTIKRNVRLYKRQECPQWKGWPLAYDSCKDLVAQVVQNAVSQKKLQPRKQLQFEIFSADIMIDTSHKAWLIECNFGCVLFDPTIGQPLTTTGLMQYQRLYDTHGEAAVVNDHEMITDTAAMIFDQSTDTKWDSVASF
jgi:hypothetical protein